MNLKKVVFGLLLLTLIFTGCQRDTQEIIMVDMRNEENNQYETHKTIMDSDQVPEVKNILNNVKWQPANGTTATDPEYIIYFFLDKADTEEKQAPSEVYELYTEPDDNKLGIFSEDKYAKLSEEDSLRLISILTYEKK